MRDEANRYQRDIHRVTQQLEQQQRLGNQDKVDSYMDTQRYVDKRSSGWDEPQMDKQTFEGFYDKKLQSTKIQKVPFAVGKDRDEVKVEVDEKPLMSKSMPKKKKEDDHKVEEVDDFWSSFTPKGRSQTNKTPVATSQESEVRQNPYDASDKDRQKEKVESIKKSAPKSEHETTNPYREPSSPKEESKGFFKLDNIMNTLFSAFEAPEPDQDLPTSKHPEHSGEDIDAGWGSEGFGEDIVQPEEEIKVSSKPPVQAPKQVTPKPIVSKKEEKPKEPEFVAPSLDDDDGFFSSFSKLKKPSESKPSSKTPKAPVEALVETPVEAPETIDIEENAWAEEPDIDIGDIDAVEETAEVGISDPFEGNPVDVQTHTDKTSSQPQFDVHTPTPEIPNLPEEINNEGWNDGADEIVFDNFESDLVLPDDTEQELGTQPTEEIKVDEQRDMGKDEEQLQKQQQPEVDKDEDNLKEDEEVAKENEDEGKAEEISHQPEQINEEQVISKQVDEPVVTDLPADLILQDATENETPQDDVVEDIDIDEIGDNAWGDQEINPDDIEAEQEIVEEQKDTKVESIEPHDQPKEDKVQFDPSSFLPEILHLPSEGELQKEPDMIAQPTEPEQLEEEKPEGWDDEEGIDIDIEVDDDHLIVDEPYPEEEPTEEINIPEDQIANEIEINEEEVKQEENQVSNEVSQPQEEVKEKEEISEEPTDMLRNDTENQQLAEAIQEENIQPAEPPKSDTQDQPEELMDLEVDEGWGGEELNVDDDYINLQEGKSASEEDDQVPETSPEIIETEHPNQEEQEPTKQEVLEESKQEESKSEDDNVSEIAEPELEDQQSPQPEEVKTKNILGQTVESLPTSPDKVNVVEATELDLDQEKFNEDVEQKDQDLNEPTEEQLEINEKLPAQEEPQIEIDDDMPDIEDLAQELEDEGWGQTDDIDLYPTEHLDPAYEENQPYGESFEAVGDVQQNNPKEEEVSDSFHN